MTTPFLRFPYRQHWGGEELEGVFGIQKAVVRAANLVSFLLQYLEALCVEEDDDDDFAAHTSGSWFLRTTPKKSINFGGQQNVTKNSIEKTFLLKSSKQEVWIRRFFVEYCFC